MAETNYQVLARKWRPQRFEDVVGQEHVTRTLKNAIAQGRIPHAFLFIGSRGIGKTTTARILAKALNCQNAEGPTPEPCGVCSNCIAIAQGTSIDVLEIDGASNNGVENVREIRENIRMVPTNGRYKVYIIDEVHQLSSGAFNALLKTLEEPPAHGIFILATTEAHKIPATIISRCQRYDFRRVDSQRIVTLLRGILDAEGKQASDEALYAIARAAEGGIRDAESILDQLISYCEGEITYTHVIDVLGLVDWAVLHQLCDALLARDIATLLIIVDDVVAAGKDLSQFVQELLQYFRGLLLCQTADPTQVAALSPDEVDALRQRAEHFTLTNLIRLVEQMAELTKGFDWQIAQRVALEAFLIRVSKVAVERSVDAVLEKLLALQPPGSGPANPRPAPPDSRPQPAAATQTREASTPVPAPPPAPAEVPAQAAAPPPAEVPAAEPQAEDRPYTREEKPLPPPVTLADRGLARYWEPVLAAICERELLVGVRLGAGRPLAVRDGVLHLEFDHDQAGAHGALMRGDVRTKAETWLQRLTNDVVRIEAELAPPPAGTPNEPVHEEPSTIARRYYPAVDAEAAEQALRDPHIAQVMDVFKGRICAIRAINSLAHPPEQE